MKITVAGIAHRAIKDIDPDGRIDVKVMDALVNRAAASATQALKNPPSGYSELQSGHITWIFDALRFTHKTLRDLLSKGSTNPGSIDALALARLQLESLYSTCLIVEDSKFLDLYIKGFWRDNYIRFLLVREECKGLHRFDEYLNSKAIPTLEALRQLSGVTDAEVATVEHEQLGNPMPSGIDPVNIPIFPSPHGVIKQTKDGSRKRMLMRLYPEYRRLCAFAHGSPQSAMFKTLFDERSKYRKVLPLFAPGEIYQREVAEPALLYSVLSVIQSSCELTVLYPADIELKRCVIEAWNVLLDLDLLCRPIWEIRTRFLLGVI